MPQEQIPVPMIDALRSLGRDAVATGWRLTVEVRPPLPEHPGLWFVTAYVVPLAGQPTFGSGAGGGGVWYEPEQDRDDLIGDLAELVHDEMSETTMRPWPPCLGHPDTMESMLLDKQPEGEIVWVCPSDPEIRALFGRYGDGPIGQPSDQ